MRKYSTKPQGFAAFCMQQSYLFTESRLFDISLIYNCKIWPAGITKKMTAITQKTVITRDDGTITVNADVFIMNEKFNYSFIFSTFVILFQND